MEKGENIQTKGKKGKEERRQRIKEGNMQIRRDRRKRAVEGRMEGKELGRGGKGGHVGRESRND